MAGIKDLYALEREVADIVADLDFYSYYQLLELAPDAGGDAVYEAYEARAGRYLEVQQTHACSPMLLRNLTVLLNRLAEARQVLTDPALRAEYDRGLELGNMRLAVAVPLPARAHEPQQTVSTAEEPDDRIEPIDRGYLDELSGQLAADLEHEGIEYAVQQAIEDAAIDPEHVQQKVEGLQRELDALGVELYEEATPDDTSADAEHAAEIVTRMEDELTEMGIEVPDSDTYRGLDEAALADPRVRPVMPKEQQRSRRPEEQKARRPGALGSQKRFKELMGRYGAKSPPKPKK